MNELGYLDSILLGVLQGLTEFLPISSSAHLALTQRWFGLDPDTPALLLFDVLVHIGTLIAVLIVFRRPIARFAQAVVRNLQNTPSTRPPQPHLARGKAASRILWLTVVASVPTAVIGLAFKDMFESAFDKPIWIGICLLITGFMLAGLAWLPRGRRGWRDFRWWQAALVGVAQAGAILPGISRSGATISAASYLGLRRRWAAEFSFLIAAPAIVGGTLLKLGDTLALPSEQFDVIPWGPLVLGSLASLVVGVMALELLLAAVRRAKLHYFAPYCWALGLIVLLTT